MYTEAIFLMLCNTSKSSSVETVETPLEVKADAPKMVQGRPARKDSASSSSSSTSRDLIQNSDKGS